MKKKVELTASFNDSSMERHFKIGFSAPLLCALSLLLHVLFLISMMLVQNMSIANTLPPVVQVDLISFSQGIPDEIPLAEEYETLPMPEDADVVENFAEPSVSLPESVPEIDPVMVSEMKTVSDTEMKPFQLEKPEPESKPESIPDLIKQNEIPESVKVEKKEAEPVEHKKPVIEKKIIKKKKSSLKKRTYDAEKVKAIARKILEKKQPLSKEHPSLKKQIAKIDNSEDQSIKEETLATALSRLKDQVESQQSEKNRAASQGTASGAKGGGAPSRVIDLYNLELMYRIRQNWVFNEKLAGRENDLEVRLVIKILKSGEIRETWFETRSGNTYLDDSALKAIKKSNPLSMLPAGYSSYDVGLIFTPSGLQ